MLMCVCLMVCVCVWMCDVCLWMLRGELMCDV